MNQAIDPSTAELIPGLDQLAVDAMADWKVPGVAIAVVKDGKLALAKAYGQRDVEANLPVTPSTQFLICSITKTFTATAVALLHDEGRLDWTKPVRDYIPEFRLSDPVATDRTTVRDLLCHQTGLPRHDWVHFAGDRSPGSANLGISVYACLDAPGAPHNGTGQTSPRRSGQPRSVRSTARRARVSPTHFCGVC